MHFGLRFINLCGLSGYMFIAGSVFATEMSEGMSDSKVKSEEKAPKHGSEDARTTKNYSVGLRSGLMYSLVPGVGLEGNWFKDKSLQLGINMGTGSISVKDAVEDDESSGELDGVNLDAADLTASSFGFHARWFPSNSFFLVGGLSRRILGTKIRVSDTTNKNNYIQTKTNSKSLCLDFGIGNLWSFDSGFFIGAEWIGVSRVLSSSSSSEAEVGGAPSSEIEKLADDNEDFAKRLGGAMTFRLAMLQLGWEF